MPSVPVSTSKIPSDIDPKTTSPGLLVQRLISRGVVPHAVIDYPRLDSAGLAISKIHVRLLTVGEQDLALANARLYVERLLASGKKDSGGLDWRPEELEHNARVAEILAVACREPDDPEKQFFVHGTYDVREHCTPEELGILANVYASLASQRLRLGNLTDDDMEKFLRAIEEGAMQHPFSFCSREDLETLLAFAAKRLAAAGVFSTGPNPTSSSSLA